MSSRRYPTERPAAAFALRQHEDPGLANSVKPARIIDCVMFKVVVSRPLVRELKPEGLVDVIEAGRSRGRQSHRYGGKKAIRRKELISEEGREN